MIEERSEAEQLHVDLFRLSIILREIVREHPSPSLRRYESYLTEIAIRRAEAEEEAISDFV